MVPLLPPACGSQKLSASCLNRIRTQLTIFAFLLIFDFHNFSANTSTIRGRQLLSIKYRSVQILPSVRRHFVYGLPFGTPLTLPLNMQTQSVLWVFQQISSLYRALNSNTISHSLMPSFLIRDFVIIQCTTGNAITYSCMSILKKQR